VISERAKIDFRIRQNVLDGKPHVTVPWMVDEQLDFWKQYAEGMERKCDFTRDGTNSLPIYYLDEPICLAYSGGLESSVLHFAFSYVPTFDFFDHKLPWTDPIEGALGIIGAGMGYMTTMIGAELDSYETYRKIIHDVGFYHELSVDYQERWMKYSGACLLPPMRMFFKDEVFNVAHRENIPFNSCFSRTGKWCGKCYKCLQISNLYLNIRKAPPFELTESRELIVSRSSMVNQKDFRHRQRRIRADL
jgi:hypothetical protein